MGVGRAAALTIILGGLMIGRMKVMASTGDDVVTWDTNDQASVDRAKQRYEDLIQKGYKAFMISPGGGKGEPISKFDWTLGEILMVPPMRGG